MRTIEEIIKIVNDEDDNTQLLDEDYDTWRKWELNGSTEEEFAILSAEIDKQVEEEMKKEYYK
jgi:hypothetical protein